MTSQKTLEMLQEIYKYLYAIRTNIAENPVNSAFLCGQLDAKLEKLIEIFKNKIEKEKNENANNMG